MTLSKLLLIGPDDIVIDSLVGPGDIKTPISPCRTLALTGVAWPRSSPGDWSVLQSPLPSPAQPRLLLAGEHTSQHLAGYANGARDTGQDQARTIIRARRGQSRE